jgi:hypothetical protein
MAKNLEKCHDSTIFRVCAKVAGLKPEVYSDDVKYLPNDQIEKTFFIWENDVVR